MAYYLSFQPNGLAAGGPCASFNSLKDARAYYYTHTWRTFIRAGEAPQGYLYVGDSPSDCPAVPEWALCFGPRGGVYCKRP